MTAAYIESTQHQSSNCPNLILRSKAAQNQGNIAELTKMLYPTQSGHLTTSCLLVEFLPAV
eukprot:CCRYP_012777-RB/>CCRYP_012777-RB protein AED:0.49 eAED:1.00 QI:0/0/0/1/0/0/2/0/60